MATRRLQSFADAATRYKGHACLLWPFGQSGGYGAFQVGTRKVWVHRFVCETAHGPQPAPGYEVAHSCRQSLCCNPAHLRWDTREGNLSDDRGMPRKNPKLSREDVLAILAQPDRSQADLASEFGVNRSLIWAIRHRKKWGWLGDGASS